MQIMTTARARQVRPLYATRQIIIVAWLGVGPLSLVGCFPDPLACVRDDQCQSADPCNVGRCEGNVCVEVPAEDACGDTTAETTTTTLATDTTSETSATDTMADTEVTPGEPCELASDCDDHDACNGVETCGADGRCRAGGTVIECPSIDDPCRVNACQPATGTCAPLPANEGHECSDGLVCTHSDTCQEGACVGTPVACDDSLACTTDGCDEETGGCVFDDKACECKTNSECSNDNACDGIETCSAERTCQAGVAVVCEPSTVPCLKNACDDTTGECALVDDDGATCDDGDLCSGPDRCFEGECLSATKDCADTIACTTDTCDGDTGACVNTPTAACACLVDGDCADDGNVCNGVPTCAHATYTCVVGAPPGNGAPCDDGQACTDDDRCSGETCAGEAIVCTAPADPCRTNTCAPATGECVLGDADDGTPCDDDDMCTRSDSCTDGACVGRSPVVCEALSDCHQVGACNPQTGLCSNPNAPLDSSCDAGDSPGFCQAGQCSGRVLSLRFAHACVVFGGNVRCWGKNDQGELGFVGAAIGFDTPASAAPLLDFPRDVVDVDTTDGMTCVRFDDGTARCWGYGGFGGLGNGSLANQPKADVAPNVSLPGVFTTIRTSGVVTCGLRSDNTLWCFGSNFDGALGHPGLDVISDPSLSVPVDLGTDLPILEVSVGPHVCALFDIGDSGSGDNVKCWGLGFHGQLGQGGFVNIDDPSSIGFVPLGGTAVHIQSGIFHTCALLEDGSLKCWGRNSSGQLGLGTHGEGLKIATPPSSPIAIGGSVSKVTVGLSHTCALMESDVVRCWGEGSAALGLETTAIVSSPLAVNAETGVEVGGTVLDIQAGSSATCALLSSGAIRCWGSAADGVLGLGTGIDYGGIPGSMPPPNVPFR